jgi:AcrR family transcriptional regulator
MNEDSFMSSRSTERSTAAGTLAEPLDSVDGRRAQRRQQLLDAAIRVMQDTGYHEMSMQALATEAGVSVGLAYRYFASKEEVLLAAIVAILDALRAELPTAAESGSSASERLCATFAAYVRVIDRYRHSVLLTYRESATLSVAGRELIKRMEVATAEPLAGIVRNGITSGEFVECDVELIVSDMVLLAHGWALKHWLFARTHSVEDYIAAQCRTVHRALGAPGAPGSTPQRGGTP